MKDMPTALVALVLAAVLSTLWPLTRGHVSAQNNDGTASLAIIVAEEAGAPLADARIEIPALNITLMTDERGRAFVDGLPTSRDESCPLRVDIIISADGYGDFTFKNFPLFPGTSKLTPRLRDEPVVDDFTNRPRAGAQIECPDVLPTAGASVNESLAPYYLLPAALGALGLGSLSAALFLLRRRT